ncbi:MAG: alpha/beta fold hydrolase [Actinobacteria bacterium]|nr:MAG: alpha/beta fold hydrolase [Actinomycetota bacterium]
MLARPPTRYARSGDASIAFQVMGEGPPDVVLIGGPASHLDLQWEEPDTRRGRQRIASFARLIIFDRRGTGLSDPVDRPATLEQQMDDLDAVLDAAGTERVAIIGALEAGLSAMYAASHPHRVSALVLANVAVAGGVVFDDDRRQLILDLIENHWGEGRFLQLFAPSRAGDQHFVDWWTRFERSSVSPSMARKTVELNAGSDLSGVLPTIQVPTLVLHRRDNPLIPVDAGREAAALIPGARFVEASGTDLYDFPGADDPETDLIEEFLTGRRPQRGPERVLATVLFTDIVESTGHAARLGDRAWRELLDRHNALVRDRLGRFRGREVKTVGDGFVATFDGPARAVRCAHEIVEGVDELGLAVRCGLHTGECELLGGDVGGIAVHIGARVCALARGGEVLVSSTVKDLVVGSELRFEDRSVHQLRGVPGEWRLYALRSG